MFKQSVTVGIPTLNGPERLTRCLESIEQCTVFDRFENVKVLVCDDGSTEENLKLNKDAIHRSETLRRRTSLEMIMSDRRCGIAASWNKLVRQHPSRIIVLANDDIEVVDDWLDVLMFSVCENRHAGMVSLNQFVGVTKLQVAMVQQTPLRIDYREAKLLNGDGLLAASSGSIFAFSREAYESVGGFDERYFCFYEEVDFGVMLRNQGYCHYIADYPTVFHMGGATNSEPKNLDAAAQLIRSRQLFTEKWGATPAQIRDGLVPVLVGTKTWNTQLKFLQD